MRRGNACSRCSFCVFMHADTWVSERMGGLAGCAWSCPGRGGAGEYPGIRGAAKDAALLSSTGFVIFNVLLSSADP